MMTDNSGYKYMHEELIGERSKCTICCNPLVDPVSTKCETKPHIFCRRCIEDRIKRYHSCQMCNQELDIQDLTPIHNNDLIDALDKILVTCIGCEQKGLERGNFNAHITQKCPKANVSCSSSDIKCQWVGPRDQLNIHLTTCIFNQLRPLITQLQIDNQQREDQINQLNNKVKQQQIQIEEHKNNNQKLKSQIEQQLKNQTEKLEKCMQQIKLICLKPLRCYNYSYMLYYLELIH